MCLLVLSLVFGGWRQIRAEERPQLASAASRIIAGTEEDDCPLLECGWLEEINGTRLQPEGHSLRNGIFQHGSAQGTGRRT